MKKWKRSPTIVFINELGFITYKIDKTQEKLKEEFIRIIKFVDDNII